MLGAILALVANAVAVIAVEAILPDQVKFTNFEGVALFALIVGLLNALLRPIVRLLTAPIGCVTLGLFGIVINGLMFWLAAQFRPDWVNATFLGATIAALAAGLLSSLLGALTADRRERH